jgi:antitoxin HicB
MSKTKRAGLGSSFEDFLKETGDYEAVTKAALKAVLAWQLERVRAQQGVTKAALAERMKTSRSQLNRLLDPENEDVTLAALQRAAAALGRRIKVELSEERAVPPGKRAPAKAARRAKKAPRLVRAAKYG